MIERVVVPVSFTSEAERALVVAPTLADWAGAGVELLSVVRPGDRLYVEPIVDAAARELGPRASFRIVESEGPVEAVLLTELRQGSKELWCIGSHSRSALGELILDGLSEELVRQAHVPIVLVGPGAKSAPTGRVMVVALDGSEGSESSLGPAAELAAALGMTLRLLQVSSAIDGELPADTFESGYLAHMRHELTGVDPATIDFDVLHGSHPAHDLAEYTARQSDVGMIALATRGLIARQRLLHHSTTFDVAHHATVPVLALHEV